MRQLVEYLYSGHIRDLDSDETDVVGVMALANRYHLPHLVSLCELYVSKQIERATALEVVKSDIDVIGLLLTAQSLNASQLASFCLHYVSTKYRSREVAFLHSCQLPTHEEEGGVGEAGGLESRLRHEEPVAACELLRAAGGVRTGSGQVVLC
jgi:hypothetical protein